MYSKKMAWWKVELGDQAPLAAAEAVRQGKLGLGGIVGEFEQRISALLGGGHVIAVTNGTTALMLSLLEAGIGPGDEVIVPDRTWIATAHAAQLLGAQVVLVDVEKERPLMDLSRVEAAITSRTKAIIPVHLNGRAVDMSRLHQIADSKGIYVIEDAAQAFMSRSKEGLLGTLSRSGCFSLSVAKVITSGQGGFIYTKDAEVAARLRLARIHGTADVVHCKWEMPGGNFRFTDINAAIALTQLDRLQERLQSVIQIHKYYTENLKNHPKLRMLPAYVDQGEIPIYVECMCPERDAMVDYLAEKQIEIRPMYPDLHIAKHFRCEGSFENAKPFGRDCVVLPCGPDRKISEIDQVLDALWKWK